MTHTCLVRFARAYDPSVILAPVRGTGTLYERRGLRVTPSGSPAAVVIDHDFAQQVGVVRDISRMEWPGGPWFAALCELEAPPGWIRRGTPASFAYKTLHAREHNGWTHVTDAILDEITIVSGAMRAVEPALRSGSSAHAAMKSSTTHRARPACAATTKTL